MGKTTPTTAILLQQERVALSRYRRSLTKPYQRAFDTIWVYASHYQMPCTCANYVLPFHFYLLSILLHQQKILRKLPSSVPKK